jgi:hypothetical protein
MNPDMLQTWGAVVLLMLGSGAAAGAAAYALLKRSVLGRTVLPRGERAPGALQALETDVATLQQQMLDLQERLDFSERMVVQLMSGERMLDIDAGRTPTPPDTPALR